jgi:CBS domain containing-hemolysin-like protein
MILAATFNITDGVILAAVLILLSFSGILALAETSLVRTSKARARSLQESKKRGAKSLYRLTDNPERFLSPILLLVLICQLVSATLLGIIAENIFGALGVAVATFIEIIFIFILAEAIPKHWAVRHPDRAALFSAPIITAIINFLPVKAISAALIGLANLLTKENGEFTQDPDVTESELLALADVAVEEDVIEEQERELISSIIEFGDTIVREVMVPRPDIVAVEKNRQASEVLEIAMTAGLSRIPVFDTTIDNIIGIAYTKDLIKVIREGQETLVIGDVARPARYVPETKKVAPLLREMQKLQTHLVVVVDEYGGTAGIVTLEDLIEELVGEIADEFDVDEPGIEPLGNTTFRLSGRMSVDEVNDLLQTSLPNTDSDTIAGLFLHLKGHIPQEGETITIGPYTLIAEKIQGRRIGKIRITKSGNSLEENENWQEIKEDELSTHANRLNIYKTAGGIDNYVLSEAAGVTYKGYTSETDGEKTTFIKTVQQTSDAKSEKN